MPIVGRKPGPKGQKPKRLHRGRGYDREPQRQLLRRLGITPVLLARNTGHGSGLGRYARANASKVITECVAGTYGIT